MRCWVALPHHWKTLSALVWARERWGCSVARPAAARPPVATARIPCSRTSRIRGKTHAPHEDERDGSDGGADDGAGRWENASPPGPTPHNHTLGEHQLPT